MSESKVFFIEPTNICNLRCAMCPTNREMTRSKGFMSLKLYRTVIDDIVSMYENTECYLNMWGWGEPLLHKKICSMIDYATKKNLHTRISSNFDSVEIAIIEDIISSGLKTIIIGIDGISPGIHDKYRIGGSVTRVLNNVMTLAEIKERQNVKYPHIVVTTLLTSQVENELSSLKRQIEEIGADALLLKYPNIWRSGKTDEEIKSLYNSFIKECTTGSRYTCSN